MHGACLSAPLSPANFPAHCVDDLAAAVTVGKVSRWDRLLSKLRDGGTVEIIVLGASTTAGMGCFQPANEQSRVLALSGVPCSWSARFAEWLRVNFPRCRVVYHNFARGGSQTEVAVGGLAALLSSARDPDVVFTDFSINDVIEPRNILRPQAFRTGLERVGARTKLGVVNEAMVLALHDAFPHALHIAMLAQCPVCMRPGGMSRMSAIRASLDFHNITTIDLARAHTSGQFREWSADEGVDAPGLHPNWKTHQHYSEVVAYAVASQVCGARTPWRNSAIRRHHKRLILGVATSTLALALCGLVTC
jgi:hypothetical protein